MIFNDLREFIAEVEKVNDCKVVEGELISYYHSDGKGGKEKCLFQEKSLMLMCW